MDSYSGIVIEETRSSEQFTDFTPIPCKGFNTLCKAKRYGRWWMLKGLKAEFRWQPTYQALLHKEFDILVSLQHPNIVAASSMEDVAELGPCIVMEWIDGITLDEWIAKHNGNVESNNDGKLPDKARIYQGERILMQLLDAVGYIHARQITHRDLKPSNIMITYNGNHVKLIDFGLSDTDSYDILKQPAGTLGYISPEQATIRQTDIRNDIYSIGCILQRMQLGKVYRPIVERCTADIEKRYQSVEALREDISRKKTNRLGQRFRLVASVIAGIAVSICIGYTLLYNSKPELNNDKSVRREVIQIRQSADNSKGNADNSAKVSPDAHIQIGTSSSAKAATQKITDGKEAIDRMWREAGIDTMRNVADRSEALFQFVEKSNEYITVGYPKTLGNSIDGSQKAYITNELSAYASEKYVKPAIQSLQSAK